MADGVNGAASPDMKIGVVVIHGVGEAETGWINASICDPLAKISKELQTTPHSELHRLSDKGAAEPDSHFTVFVRRARLQDRAIAFAELGWSDLSRVGRGMLALAAAVVKLFFEAPDILAQAFLRKRRTGIHAVIALLILTASRILTWLVVGLNLVIVLAAFYVAGAIYFIEWLKTWVDLPRPSTGTVGLWLTPLLLVLFVAGLWLFIRKRHREIGLSEFGLGTALSALIVFAYLTAAAIWPVDAYIQSFIDVPLRSQYDIGRVFVFLAWVAWCAATLLAIGLLSLVWLKRRLFGDRATHIPLTPAWAALCNILLQAIILKLVIAPVSILACNQLNAAAGKQECTPGPISGVFFFALLELVFIVLALIYVARSRDVAVRAGKPGTVPRLIVHPLLVATAAVAVMLHIGVFAGEVWGNGYGYDFFLPPWVHNALGAAPLVTVYLFLLQTFYNSSAGIIHIARDIVDHQYQKSAAADIVDWSLADGGKDAVAFPRRHQIAGRLDSLIENLVAGGGLERLIFLTHSQGTVVAFDYLRSDSSALSQVGEIHVVTLGSPLSHLYAHYFDEYQRPVDFAGLRDNVRSWTNFWRLDDPIGDRVDVVHGGLNIRNEPLGTGGHSGYWREDKICKLILQLLSEPAAAPKAGSLAA